MKMLEILIKTHLIKIIIITNSTIETYDATFYKFK